MSGRRRLEISFAAPTFFRPERVQIKYRLNDYDSDWIDADGTRVAAYMNLRPGDYQFRVIAENGDGVWNEEGDTLSFTVVPRWFQTLWFRASIVLTVMGIGMCVFTLRMRVTRARHEEIQRHRDELARASRVTMMGELAASIAHEINQPLCAILNNANSGQRILAGNEMHIEDAREAFDDIAIAAKRASEVIEHIRELLANHSIQRAPLDVTGLLRDSLALLESNLEEHRLQLIVETESRLPRLLGDRVELQQVMINLVTNAAHAIGAAASGPRTITIHASHRDNEITVSVRDTGVGFEKDQRLDRLFDAFYTTRSDGLGMGLAITKTIVEAHGGRIWAERNADRGATFTFAIPAMARTDNA